MTGNQPHQLAADVARCTEDRNTNHTAYMQNGA
jgi:hypothetical protein